MGTAVPGPPVATVELLERIDHRFHTSVVRRGTILADRLGIQTRHICRDFTARHETPRPGHSNPELATKALHVALAVYRRRID